MENRMAVPIFAPSTRTFSLCLQGRYQNGREEEQLETHVGQMDETSGSGGTNTSVRSSILGVHAAHVSRTKRLLKETIFSTL